MNENEQNKEKLQAQLDAWKADIAKLKDRVLAAKTDAQITMEKKVLALERRQDYLDALKPVISTIERR